MQRKSPRPEWLKVQLPNNEEYFRLKTLVQEQRLHTVCRDAHCPNIGECWGAGTATFMILGGLCTRDCRFCAVQSGRPLPADPDEPRRIAAAVKLLGLKYIVLTSVTRDDLPDGGAFLFAETVRHIRTVEPGIKTELLIPDFCGDNDALQTVIAVRPDVLGHNIETVPRLYSEVRESAVYTRSLTLLKNAKSFDAAIKTKSGIMLGLGETDSEIACALEDLRKADVDIVTIGQYLQPSYNHLPVRKYYTPQEFADLRKHACSLGFHYVASGPLVRSSYHAHEAVGINSYH